MNLKLSLFALASLGVAASASAVSLTFQSTGTIFPDPATAGNLKVVDTTIVPGASYSPAPLGAFTATNLTYSFVNAPTTTGTGVLTLKRTADNVLATITLNFPGFTIMGPGSGALVSSAMTLTGGTSWLAGYSGLGALSGVYAFGPNGELRGTSRSSFTADLNAVPEPASMAALALGGLGLLRRRKRA